MGGAVSSNVMNVVVNAVAKITSDITQKIKLSYDSSQIIYIKDTHGDVIIRGNKMIQKASLNMKALFAALSTSSAQQNLALEVSQLAKSLVSGLNLGQFSEADNDMNLLINTTIEITTKIGQECAVMAEQNQEIWVEHTIGSVTIENNLMEQMANVMESCIEDAVNNSQAIQDIILKLKQDSSATAEGLSAWVLVAMFGILIGVPVIGGVVGGKAVLQYLFPIMAVVGVILLMVYYFYYTEIIVMKAYSTFIENTDACLFEPPKPIIDTTFANAVTAGNHCMQDTSCVAFDWKALNVTNTGAYTNVIPPQTKFYTSVSNECMSDIKQDNVSMLRVPVVYVGAGPPPATIPNILDGDCYIDLTTSEWYQLKSNWFHNQAIIDVKFTKVSVGKTVPQATDPGNDGDFIIVYVQNAPEYFNTYKRDKIWTFYKQVSGPGLYAAAPAATNGSGFKVIHRTEWLLYSGIGAVVLGILGTIIVFVYGKKSAAVPPVKK
jgi:hypothetical protein